MIEVTDAERDTMRRVCDAAAMLYTGDGPVFVAAVMQGDEVLALEPNRVAETRDASRHAEIEAMAKAGAALGSKDLSGLTLLTSMQPCEMCLAAMRWAGIDRLIFAMTQEEAPAFFQFPALSLDDFAKASDGVFQWQGGVEIDRVRHIYR